MKKTLWIIWLILLCTFTPVYAITCADVTCDEARNYPQMDRDKDGYYCEAQCGSYTPSKKTETKSIVEPKKIVEPKSSTEPKKTTTKQSESKKAETKTTSKKSSKYISWPKWWCYYLNAKKKKVYVDKKYCN